jgi:hypothetical protein
MKYLPFILIIVIVAITGCATSTQSSTNGDTKLTETFSSTDPSAPASYAEKYCLEVVSFNVVKRESQGKYQGVDIYSPSVTVIGTIKSNCNYPVEGSVQLFAYDKNNNMIPGLFPKGVQDSQPIHIKPGQTKTISTTFDMRRVPDNPRDPDMSSTANFNIVAFVTRIVSAREVAQQSMYGMDW